MHLFFELLVNPFGRFTLQVHRLGTHWWSCRNHVMRDTSNGCPRRAVYPESAGFPRDHFAAEINVRGAKMTMVLGHLLAKPMLGGPGWLLCTCDTCYVHSEVVKYILDLALATLSELSADTASTLNLLSWSTCCT